MERKDELNYLLELVLEASKWKLSEGDERDTIRLEVEHRLRVLTGSSTGEPDDTGLIHDYPKGETVIVRQEGKFVPEVKFPVEKSVMERYAEKHPEHIAPPEKVYAALEKARNTHAGKVRCKEGDRMVWHPIDECRKVPRDCSKGGPKFQWKWFGNEPEKLAEIASMAGTMF